MVKATVSRIDIDCSDEDEAYIIQNIIDTIGKDKVAHVFAIGTNQELGAIDDIGRALSRQWINENGKSTRELKIKKKELQHSTLGKDERKEVVQKVTDEIKEIDEYNSKLNNPWSLKVVAKVKKLWQENKEECKKQYPEICKYMDGIVGVKISASIHPAGIIVSPVTLDDNYGIMINDSKRVIQLDMDAAHDVNLVKYDILKLKSVKVLKKICDYLHKPYPRSYEVDWDDKDVWDDLSNDNLAIPQFESAFSSQLIKTMHPNNVEELAIINAAIRPAGASYRDELTHRQQHHSKNPEVDKALSSTYSFMVFQEQIMQFLQEFCGFSGSESDDIRRAVGAKDAKKIEATVPIIIEAYCKNRDLPHKEAEEEAQEYVQVIRDASAYAFNKSHAVAYSMLGYLFAYMKHYHPAEFITAFLNYADNEDDIINGTKLALTRNFRIEEPVFRHGQSEYTYDNKNNIIYKGMGSIKYLNNKVADQLYRLRNKTYKNFFYVLDDIRCTSINSRQLDILIKLNFFREFGNAKLILNYVNMWNKFKTSGGNYIQSLKKDFTTSSVLKNIVEHHATETNTRYQITDMFGIFDDISDVLQSLNIKDFSIKEKIATQKEYLGYISLKTDKKEDIHKLYIVDMIPLKVKKGNRAGQIWARILKTHSIGRGKNGEMMILENDYQKQYQFQKEDVIEFDVSGFKKDSYNGTEQYWISKYNIVLD